MLTTIVSHQRLLVKQVFELGEIFGFETRNKYRICDDIGRDLGYAAEQQKGFFGFLFRQWLGHWRKFDIHFFTTDRRPFMIAHHPFRWFFQRLEIFDVSGQRLGAIQRRFSILSKQFHIENAMGRLLMEVHSPIWKPWTFPFRHQGREVACIRKKWSGIGYEMLTDRDNFLVEFSDVNMSVVDRSLVLAAAVYIDMLFFEQKAHG
jgi:uncharacterized protein YxjI